MKENYENNSIMLCHTTLKLSSTLCSDRWLWKGAMPPYYFIAVLVVAAGSVCFADEGVATAEVTGVSNPSIYCPGSSCREICKCNSEYGTTSCSKMRDNYTIFLRLGYCMNLLNESVTIGQYPYASSKWRTDKFDHYSFRYNELFLNNSMCDDLNRQENLCSNCKEGYGVAMYSGSWYCSPCTLGGYAWLLYIALETVPVTIFFLAVVFFNVRATSPPMTGFILFNQILVTFLRNQIILVPLLKTFPNAKYILSIGLTVSGFWNLDFFRDIIPHFCVTHHLSNFGMIVFRCFFAIYPFLLLVVLVVCIKLYNRGIKPFVCLWKPIHRYFARHRRAFNANASLVDAMTTFLLLSYFNIVTILVYFFQWTRIRILCGNSYSYTTFLIDPDGSHKLLQYIPVILVALVILILPPFLLITYPSKAFRKCLARTRLNDWQPLHMFVEKFQGDYKDGTQGTYDYRFLSGIYLVFRVALAVPLQSSSNLSSDYYKRRTSALLFFVVIFFALVQPYKKRYMNILESLLFTICWLINYCYIELIVHSHHKILTFIMICILAAIPMCAFIFYSGYKCTKAWVRKNKWLAHILRWFTAQRQGRQEESETLIESFADRLQNPRRYGSLVDSQESISNTREKELESSGDISYK